MKKRNRIVINFDNQGQPGLSQRRPGRTGRAGRILGIIAVILVVIVVAAAAGAYFWWENYKTKPAYSLALLIDAAQRNDMAEIDRLLDMDKITDSFISQVRQRAGEAFPSVVGAATPAQLDQAASVVAPKLKTILHDSLPGEVKRLSETASGKPFVLIALGVPYVVAVKQEGNTARAEVQIKDEHVKLTLQQEAAGRWRVVAVEDDRLVGIIADSVRKDLPPLGTGWQGEAERRLKGLKVP